MDLDRRKFLVATAAAAACVGTSEKPPTPPALPDPAPERAASPDPYEPAGPVDHDLFPWGIRIGDPTSESGLVGLKSSAASVHLILRSHVEGDWVEVVDVELIPEDGFVHHAVTGLSADTAHTVWAEADGVRSEATRFRTAPDPGLVRQVVFGATSCLGGNPLTNLLHVEAHDLDFFLMLGDAVYADGSVTLEDYRAEWHAKFTKEELRALSRSTGWVSTWDDHEVANNWFIGEGGTPLQDAVSVEIVAAATQAFRESVPMGVGPGGSGLWRSLSWGDVADLFVLDCRGERGPDTVISEEQLTWIEGALAQSTAEFKVVLVSVHVTDHLELMNIVAQEDRWQGYPAQRARLLEAAVGVPGVFFITGDMHYGAVQRVDMAGGPAADLYEIAAGPSGSNIFPMQAVAEIGGGTLPAQYETLLETWSWCRIAIDPGTRSVSVQFIGTEGDTLAEQVFSVL